MQSELSVYCASQQKMQPMAKHTFRRRHYWYKASWNELLWILNICSCVTWLFAKAKNLKNSNSIITLHKQCINILHTYVCQWMYIFVRILIDNPYVRKCCVASFCYIHLIFFVWPSHLPLIGYLCRLRDQHLNYCFYLFNLISIMCKC